MDWRVDQGAGRSQAQEAGQETEAVQADGDQKGDQVRAQAGDREEDHHQVT